MATQTPSFSRVFLFGKAWKQLTLAMAFAVTACAQQMPSSSLTNALNTNAAPKRIATPVGELAVWEYGLREPAPGGQVLVLWPSILADHRMYEPLIAQWKSTHRIIAIDGPGHGASGPAPGPFTMAQCAQAMQSVLDALSVQQSVVPVGTSWGGLVGGEFAIAYPQRTRALVMLNTPVFADPANPSFADRFVAWGARWINGTSLYTDGVERAFFLPATRARGGATLDHFRRHIQEANGPALSQAVRSVLVEREPLAPRMLKIATPTLFVTGTQDTMYPMDSLRSAVATLPKGQFVALPTAHISVVDEPVRTQEVVDAFLASVGQAR
jgi:3-oxoadipate enol-lactonase